MEFVSNSVEDTYGLAKRIAEKCTGGEVILLNGELGAGKTTFTKGFAQALGINNTVTSPTFTIMKTYYGRLTMHHFDMYRIGNADEVEELGLTDYLFGDDVCLIEWNKFTDLPKKIIKIDIEYMPCGRKFLIEGLDI